MSEDTIAAISTAAGSAGIGIVRISGPESFEIADRVYVSPGGQKRLSGQKTHTIHYGYIHDGEKMLDEVLVMLMRAPRSYTTEDTVEINCHGGIYAARRILDAVLCHGARPAEPGEFTKRAFLNGRIDLSQAESVMDIIQAKNEYALRNSVRLLRGTVSRKIKSLRERILYQTAFIESALDDPEHYSLEGYAEVLQKETETMSVELDHLILSAEDGKVLKEGVCTVILGKPNAGKSSLMNILSGEDRAIVTDIAGTTRDAVEESISMRGITLNLVDTAGIRDSEDPVEKIGVSRTLEKAQEADLILYVADSSAPLDENDEKILPLLDGKKTVVLLNKSDLPVLTDAEKIRSFTGGRFPVLGISAKTGEGIEIMEETLCRMFYHGELSCNDEVFITGARQKSALLSAAESLRRVQESISLHMPEDFFSIDLMSAYEALGSITGESVGEDLIDEIFGKFCMGK